MQPYPQPETVRIIGGVLEPETHVPDPEGLQIDQQATDRRRAETAAAAEG